MSAISLIPGPFGNLQPPLESAYQEDLIRMYSLITGIKNGQESIRGYDEIYRRLLSEKTCCKQGERLAFIEDRIVFILKMISASKNVVEELKEELSTLEGRRVSLERELKDTCLSQTTKICVSKLAGLKLKREKADDTDVEPSGEDTDVTALSDDTGIETIQGDLDRMREEISLLEIEREETEAKYAAREEALADAADFDPELTTLYHEIRKIEIKLSVAKKELANIEGQSLKK